MTDDMGEKHINDGGLMTTGRNSEAMVFDSIPWNLTIKK